jgi:cell division protease FtsH
MASALAFLTVLGCLTWFAAAQSGQDSVQQVPITGVLNLADRHQLRSVTIIGDQAQAVTIKGQQLAAVKESQQSITEQLRHNGITVFVQEPANTDLQYQWF